MFIVIDFDEETQTEYVSGLDRDQVMVVSAARVCGDVVVIDHKGTTLFTSSHISKVIDFFERVS
jgi:hypothetical protein